MEKRDLSKVLCTTCGSAYEVLFDHANNEYICRECVDAEEDEAQDDEDEDEEE